MMVSLIQSNYRGMGSGLVPDGLGFMLQDRGELFSLQRGHPNQYMPGRRPFQTIIPAFALSNGQPWLAFGVMGGDMQPQGHVQIIVNLVDYGLDLQAAGDAARYRFYGGAEPTGDAPDGVGFVAMENGVPPDVRAELERRGHRIRPADGSFGGYQAIMRNANGVYEAATEMRKDGSRGRRIDAQRLQSPPPREGRVGGGVMLNTWSSGRPLPPHCARARTYQRRASPHPLPPPLKGRGFALLAAVAFLLTACGPNLGALEKGEEGRVVRAYNGDTLELDSGLRVFLAEIDAPRGDEEYARQAQGELEALALHRNVRLAYGGTRRWTPRVREGRAPASEPPPETAVAHVFVQSEGGRWFWLQHELVSRGRRVRASAPRQSRPRRRSDGAGKCGARERARALGRARLSSAECRGGFRACARLRAILPARRGALSHRRRRRRASASLRHARGA